MFNFSYEREKGSPTFYKKLGFILIFLCSSLVTLVAQPPNDDPCFATVVVPDGSCANSTTVDATPDLSDPGCFNNNGNAVWFQVSLGAGMDVLDIDLSNISIDAGGIISANVYTLDLDCSGSMNQVPGGDFCNVIGAGFNLNITGLTGSTDYYIQIITTGFQAGDFSICFTEDGPLPCPSPDDCGDATPIVFMGPTLLQCIEGCNTGASFEQPNPSGGCFDFQNETTWYTVPFLVPMTGAPPYFSYDISITSDDLTQPQIAVFQDCGALIEVACATGTNGQAQLLFDSGDFPFQDYLIAVSDAGGLTGEYELCVEPFEFLECNTDSDIEVVSTSFGSPLTGPFQPGEEVEICLNVNNFNSGPETNCNFLHGIVPRFGQGWDLSSFQFSQEPANITTPLTNNTNQGTWDWVPLFNVFYNDIPNGHLPPGTPLPSGWWYILHEGNNPACTDLQDPNCTRGDGVDPDICTNGNGASWQVCFVLTTNPYPDCEIPGEDDLSISFRTYGDGETGGNQGAGCYTDQEWELPLSLNCCATPFLSPQFDDSFCNGESTSFSLASTQDPNVEYTWTVSPNTVGASPCDMNCPSDITQTLTNNTPAPVTVTYTVSLVDASTGCNGPPVEMEATVYPELTLDIVPQFPVCPNNCTSINTVVTGGQPPYNYLWTGGIFGANPQACPNDTTTYYLTVTDANFCTVSDSTVVYVSPPPIVEITTDPDQTEICENDPEYPIEITATVTNDNGSFYLYNWGVHGSGLGTIEAEESDFYMVTVTDALTQCSGESFIGITVNPTPPAFVTEPGFICGGDENFCLEGIPAGGTWESDDITIDGIGCFNPSQETFGVKDICYTYQDNFTGCDSTYCLEITISANPVLAIPNDTTLCDNYTLPVIEGTNLTGSEAYYDAPDGGGTSYQAGDIISASTTLFIYVDDGSGLCGDETSFDITIDVGPVLDPVSNINQCGSYTLPTITGTNLTGNEAYYEDQNGMGISYNAGDLINASVNLYVFDENNICNDQEFFEIIINDQPEIDDLQNVIACEEYILPAITGNNLTGNEAYFDQTNGQGNTYTVGDVISSDIILYLYDDSDNGNCFDETSFEISILPEPSLDQINDIQNCGPYTLTAISGTNLSGNQAYYSAPGGTGISYSAGDVINNSITLYIYDQTSLNTCFDEVSFDLEIINQPTINPINDETACDEFTLQNITGSNLTGNEAYFDQPDGNGVQYNPGDIISSDIVLYAFDETAIDGCSDQQSFSITINDTPVSSFTLDTPICENSFTTITFDGSASLMATYDWNFNGGTIISGSGQGPYEISWDNPGTYNVSLSISENGCNSTLFEQNIVVDPELSLPIINCNPSTNSIEFTWPDVTGANSYVVTVLNGPLGVLNGNTYTVSGLTPGQMVEIQLEAVGNTNCGNTISTLECAAQDCPPIVIDIDPVNDICSDFTNAPIDLNATISNSDGTGTGTWSGSFISSMGSFDIIAAGIGSHVVTYTFEESSCTFSESITINIFQIPSSLFSIDDEICVGDINTIEYQGASSINGTYDWDFDGGTIISGSGQGPYEVSWANAGTYSVSLEVTENGCSSLITEEFVLVEAPLSVPVINCNSTTNEIIFSWDDIVGVDSYTVNVITGPTGVLNGTEYTVSGLSSNDEVTIEVIANNSGVCGSTSSIQTCFAQDCPPIIIDIDPVNDICLDASTMPINLNAIATGGDGSGVGTWTPSAIADPQSLGAGIHTFTYTFDEAGCSFSNSIDIEIFQAPVADFTITSPICQGDNSLITFTGSASFAATYNWNFDGGTIISGTGQGPYEISWANAGVYNVSLEVIDNGCNSNIFSNTIQVDQPLAAPVINCNSSSEEIEFSWDDISGASSYIVNVTSGPTGVLNGTTYTVSGLSANDEVSIEVIAVNNGPCGNSSATQSCYALDCPSISISIDPVNDICLDGNNIAFNLNAIVSGGDGSGSGSWSPSAMVDPANLGAGVHTFIYTFDEVGCSFNESVDIEIFQSPIADFTITSPICQGDNSLITFTGSASFAATYNWNFDGGTIISGTGQGPYEISWANAGVYNVSLEVIDNGCNSNIFSNTIQVDQPLAAPVINCNSSSEEIEFSWDDISGASSYIVNVISGPTGILNGTTYTVSGLSANDEVSIEVIAVNNGPCGNSSATQSCNALDCPSISISIDPVNDICLDGNNIPFNLNAIVSGGDGSGSGSWSPSAMVDPANLGAGVHTFIYTFDEVGCSFNESIDIEIFQSPIADFSINSPICLGDNSLITFTGSASFAATYNWDFDGGTIISGTGQGPYEISWANAGVYNVSLEIIDNGCNSNIFSNTIQVDQPLAAPVINCSSTTEEIVFSWDPILGATGYQVNVITGPAGVLNGTSYTVSGLMANDASSIEVIAIDDGPCPNSSSILSCNAMDCPLITLDIDPVNSICLDGNNPSFTLDVLITGSDGSGSGTWSPSNLVDPLALGAGVHTFTYDFEEVGCSYTSSIQITLYDLPNAEAGISDELSCDIQDLQLNGFGSSVGPDIQTQWSGPGLIINDQSLTPTVSQPGFYYISITDNNTGCSSIDSVEITLDDDVPIAIAGPDSSLTCNFTSILLQGDGSMGNDFEYNWQGPGIDISNENDISPEISEPGVYILNVVNLLNGCVSFPDTVVIEDNTNLPDAFVNPIGPANLDCNTNTVLLSGDGSTVTDVIYQWLDPQNNPIPGANTIDYEAGTAGIYTLLITNPFSGCSNSATFEIINTTAFPNANAGQTQQLDCTISSVTLDGSASETGLNISYSWSGPMGGIIGDNTTSIIQVGLPGVYTVNVLNNSNGCSSNASVTVSEDLNGPVSIAGDDIELDCDFTPINLDGSGSSIGANYTYTWINPDGSFLSNELSVSTNELGEYTLIVIDNSNDCVDSSFVNVLENSNVPVTADFDIYLPSCFGENDGSLVINGITGGTAPYVYAIDDDIFSTVDSFPFLASGTYTLNVEDSEGCLLETDFTISSPNEVTLDLGEDLFIQLGDSVPITASTNIPDNMIDTIIWTSLEYLDCLDSLCQEVETNTFNTTAYTATIIDNNGCIATDDVTVHISWDDLIFVPNVFSPNDDGINDIFEIYSGLGVEEVTQFRIFDRWGEIVFERNNFLANAPDNGWDGKLRGEELMQAVFVYYIEVLLVNGEKVQLAGDFTLIK